MYVVSQLDSEIRTKRMKFSLSKKQQKIKYFIGVKSVEEVEVATTSRFENKKLIFLFVELLFQ
jgi:hypothetical protein